MADGVIPTEDAYERIGDTVRHHEGTYRNRGLKGQKRTRIGGDDCPARNELWKLTIGGTPTGGTFDVITTILGTTETLQFNYDDDATAILTELETHSAIASGDAEVTGGPWPDTDVNIEFKADLAGYEFPPPVIAFGGLTGGTGMVVIWTRPRMGYPKDGSVAP